MHELSIARGIMANLRPWLDEQDDRLRLNEIVVKCGPFRAVVPDALEAAWDVVRKEHNKTLLSQITIDATAIAVSCGDCGYSFNVGRPVFKCPKCEGDNLSFSGGNELYIEDIKTKLEE
ncbi:hydrogenase maturation nickel metallochaperone HypA [bacterium]|nr:hydrogenase maturation nickel metallochaperone HypA [bacterium]